MDFSLICRTCLGTQFLSPIFTESDDDSYSTSVFNTTGLKIYKNDCLPQKMCKTCKKDLNNAVTFILKSKENEIKLLHSIATLKLHGNRIEDITKPTRASKKRKKSKDVETHLIKIEIEEEDCENEYETQLDKENQKAKTETLLLKIDIDEQEIDEQEIVEQDIDEEEIFAQKIDGKLLPEVKSDNTISGSDAIQEECKYETEFLDLNFDSYSDTDNLLNEKISIYRTDIQEKNITEPNSDTKNLEHDGKISKNKNKPTKTKNVRTIFKRKKHTERKDDIIKDTLSNLENLPYIVQNAEKAMCKICQKVLSRRSIDNHMASRHPGADVRKVKCVLCDKYVMKARLERHIRLKHYGNDSLKCVYCKNNYDSKEELSSHVTTCEAKKKNRIYNKEKRKEEIVECDVCNKSMQKASLRMHKDIKHAGMGPVCEHCGQRFGNKFRMNEHMRAKHGYQKYKCSVCDFLSATTTAIKNHERRHRGEKPFVCEQCGAKFHAPHLLRQHKHSHRTERNMKCDQCPAMFKANNSLHMHKSTCHNKNIYQCSQCGRTFKSRQYLGKHMRAAHSHALPVPPAAGALHQ